MNLAFHFFFRVLVEHQHKHCVPVVAARSRRGACAAIVSVALQLKKCSHGTDSITDSRDLTVRIVRSVTAVA
jgi:hypothetical protein